MVVLYNQLIVFGNTLAQRHGVTSDGITLSMPAKRVSAWMAETDPKSARAWLASLPLADSAESAREIYQALYTLNRQELDATCRFELMELYCSPVASVTPRLTLFFPRGATPDSEEAATGGIHPPVAHGDGLRLQRLPSRDGTAAVALGQEVAARTCA